MKSYIGQTLGIFEISAFAGRDKSGNSMWIGSCRHCSGTHVGRVEVLRKALSCGCLFREMLSARAKTHGKSKTAEYCIHRNMVRRCTDPTDHAFKDYGGRGITVCDSWLEDVRNFISDMGLRPTKLHTLDRKDNNGNYEPSNCRWATRIEQANNKRNVLRISFNGQSLSLREWSTLTGISKDALYLRISRGMPIERALTQRARRAK
jgi:hypothetical protein